MTQLLVLVNGLPGAGKTTLAKELGPALGGVVISKDAIKEAVADGVGLQGADAANLGGAAMDMAWALAAGIGGTVLVESWWFAPRDRAFVEAGIELVGAGEVVEVWCDAGVDEARNRYAGRQRHGVHRDSQRLTSDWELWAKEGAPLGLSLVVEVDTSGPVNIEELAARVRAAA